MKIFSDGKSPTSGILWIFLGLMLLITFKVNLNFYDETGPLLLGIFLLGGLGLIGEGIRRIWKARKK